MPFDLSPLSKISALLEDQDTSMAAGLREVRVDAIQPDPNQPRKVFDDSALAELAQSIESVGPIHPPTVRTQGQAYMLISGERRWRATRMLGKKTIQVIVRDDLDVRATAHAQLIENIQNESLSSWEIYRAIVAELESGTTQADLATALGKSRQWVQDYALVHKMPQALVTALRENRIADIIVMRHLERLQRDMPDIAARLLESPELITRKMVTDALARSSTERFTVSLDPPATVSITGARAAAPAFGDESGNAGERRPTRVAAQGSASKPKASKALPVCIRAYFQDASWIVNYAHQQIGFDGTPAVLLEGDGDLKCYGPLAELTLQSIECL